MDACRGVVAREDRLSKRGKGSGLDGGSAAAIWRCTGESMASVWPQSALSCDATLRCTLHAHWLKAAHFSGLCNKRGWRGAGKVEHGGAQGMLASWVHLGQGTLVPGCALLTSSKLM